MEGQLNRLSHRRRAAIVIDDGRLRPCRKIPLDITDALTDNKLANHRGHCNGGSASVSFEADGNNSPLRCFSARLHSDRDTKNVAADFVVHDSDGIGFIKITKVPGPPVVVEERLRVFAHAATMFARNRGHCDPLVRVISNSTLDHRKARP